MALLFVLVWQFSLTASLVSSQGTEQIPLGHLQPLGSHAPPSTIEERHDIPSAEEFWENYARSDVLKPVLFRGINKVSPVFTKWTDDYLKENFGDMELRIEMKREQLKVVPKGDKGFARDTLRNFINTYHDNKTVKYVISELPKPMYKDFLVPPFVGCGPFAKRLVEVDLWIGGGGSSSLLHKDAFHIINCLFNGTKEWKMIETKHEKNIYKVQEEPGRISGYSYINPMKVDLLKYPNVAKVPWSFVNVTPGDCLYIPRSMYHQVKSFGSHNLAISLLFSRFDTNVSMNFSDCPAKGFKPLSEIEADWEYPGSGTFSMGNSDLEFGTKGELKELLQDDNKINLNDLRNVLKHTETYKKTGRSDQETDELVRKFYKTFGKTEQDSITKSDIENATREQLRKIAIIQGIQDPYNTYNYEYYLIEALDIAKLLVRLLQGDVLYKEDFVSNYTSKLDGTEKHAEELFLNLGGEGKENISRASVLENVQKALFQYDECELARHSNVEYGKPPRKRNVFDYRAFVMNTKVEDLAKSKKPANSENEDEGENDEDEDDLGEEEDEDEDGDRRREGEEEGEDGLDEGDGDDEEEGDREEGGEGEEGEEGEEDDEDVDGDAEDPDDSKNTESNESKTDKNSKVEDNATPRDEL